MTSLEKTSKISLDETSGHLVLQSTVSNAYYLILLQLFHRALTFALNTFLLRYSLPFVIGLTSIRFELIVSMVAFLGREGIRGALLRYPLAPDGGSASDAKQDRLARNRQFVNMAWLPLPFGSILALAIGYFYYWHPPEELVAPAPASACLMAGKVADGLLLATYRHCVVLYVVAIVVELLYEPVYMAAQLSLHCRVRVWFEGVAILARSLTLIAGVVWVRHCGPLFFTSHGSEHVLVANDLLLFALTQVLYSVLLVALYYGFACHQARQRGKSNSPDRCLGHGWPFDAMSELLPSFSSSSAPFFEPSFFSLGLTLTQFSFLKQLLNQGDLMILSSFTSLNDQGVYSVANNYGSLVARILLQPLEETSRLLFSQGASHTLATHASSLQEKPVSTTLSKRHLLQYLFMLMKFDIYLGLFFVAFGAPFTLPLTYGLLGSSWAFETSTPLALSGFCLYIPFIALNGILESFVSSVSSTAQLRSSQLYMIFSTTVYLAFALFSIPRWLSLGVVLANIFNMTLRIIYCLVFLARYLRIYHAEANKDEPMHVARIFPAQLSLVLLAISLLVNAGLAAHLYYGVGRGLGLSGQWANSPLARMAYHTGAGALLFCLCLATIWSRDSQFLRDSKALLMSKKMKSD